MISVRLAKPLERAIRAGHPWVFRDALAPPPRIADGAVVTVASAAGRALATAFWDARSPIAARILDTAPVADPEALVDARLRAALDRRRALFDPARTNAFRWVHGEADRLPGLHVDLYDGVAVARLDGGGARAFYRDLGARLAAAAAPFALGAAVDRAGGPPLLGAPPATLVVRENGLLFETAPGHASKGGLFLDQRDNRARVESLARGRAVLNLFGYTGGFSLYAARGGAASTDTVDVSRPALAAARRNFGLNRLPLAHAGFHARDAFEFLQEAAAARRRWDLVVSDPPSFAPSRASLPRARRAYDRLHRLALAATARGGVLCAASCSSHFTEQDLVRSVTGAARALARPVRIAERRGAGEDHPRLKAFPEGDYLKFLIVEV